MNTRERDVESALVDGLSDSGILCLKFVPVHCSGMPDRLLVLPDGKTVWVELKTDGGEVGALQTYRHTVLRKLGHRVEIVWTKEQAKRLCGELTIKAPRKSEGK